LRSLAAEHGLDPLGSYGEVVGESGRDGLAVLCLHLVDECVERRTGIEDVVTAEVGLRPRYFVSEARSWADSLDEVSKFGK
jgi:hypothetical protein